MSTFLPTKLRFLAGALAPALFFSFAAAEPVVVRSVKGNVQIRRAKSETNRWYALRKGAPVKSGDTLRTGKNGRAELKLDDGSRVVVSQSSRVRVQESAPHRIFQLTAGRVKSFVKKLRPTSKFEVRTPLAAASVRGTVFEMGFDEAKKNGFLDVSHGVVSLTQGDKSVDVRGGERLGFGSDIPLGAPGRGGQPSGGEDQGADAGQGDRRREVGLGLSKENVMLAAAEEMRLAVYQDGKTLIDVHGDRVRMEEYVIRNPAEAALPDHSFKFVVLNERADRFDYFYYRGTFNQPLPEDLSVALNDMRGKLSDTAPDYFLTEYEMGMSNTQDTVQDNASGGHLVKVTYDGTKYYLETTNPADGTQEIIAHDAVTGAEGTVHTVYDPVGDRFISMTDAQYNAGGGAAAVLDGATDQFREMAQGDTYWRTNFDSYSHALNGRTVQSYAPKATVSTIMALHNDAEYTYAGGLRPIVVNDDPLGGDILHHRVRIIYADSTTESINTYIINDQGQIGGLGDFSGVASGADFKRTLLDWNYEQVYESSEFEGRKIDIVAEPKILIKSGLLK